MELEIKKRYLVKAKEAPWLREIIVIEKSPSGDYVKVYELYGNPTSTCTTATGWCRKSEFDQERAYEVIEELPMTDDLMCLVEDNAIPGWV